jgi:hypothetical protein
MRTLKGRYIVIFAVMLVLIVYQILLSFNTVPYFFTSEDLSLVLFLLLGVFLLLVSVDLSRLSSGRGERYNSLYDSRDLEAPPGQIDIGPLTERETSFFTRVQNYFKGCECKADILNRLLVASSKVTKSKRASVLLYSRKTDDLFIFRTIGWNRNELKMLRDTRIKPGEGITGRVFVEEKPLVVGDIEKGRDFEPKDKYRSKAFVSSPLFAGNDVVGVLNLTEKQDGTYSGRELEILKFLLTTVAVLMKGASSLER